MARLTLNVEQLDVVSFDAEPEPAPGTQAAIGYSGASTCLGWYSCYAKCFGTAIEYGCSN